MFDLSNFTTEKALNATTTYKYQSCENTYLENISLRFIHQPFAKLIPIWLTPNSITLLGFLSTLSYFISTIYLNKAKELKWKLIISIACVCFLCLYFILDAVDGIIARSRNMQSSFGNLLDHGLDTITTVRTMNLRRQLRIY